MKPVVFRAPWNQNCPQYVDAVCLAQPEDEY
jgi:hypothetical protein